MPPTGGQGGGQAQVVLGDMYSYGVGVEDELSEAMRWFRRAADQGYAGGQIKSAKCTATAMVYSVATLRRSAGFANPQIKVTTLAQDNLGVMYRDGLGVRRDYAEAVRWFRKAADQGYVEGEFDLSNMYADGHGVQQDYAEMVRWAQKAADQKYAAAQYNLGVAYYNGDGVPEDYVYAYMWLNLAAAAGEDQAAEHRDVVARHMTPDQIALAQKLAREWQPTASSVVGASPAAIPDVPGELVETVGTGLFISGNGEALTNAHVVEGCVQIRIRLGAQTALAQVVARDTQNDLALIKAEMKSTDTAHLRLSVRQGEDVIVYGFPLAGLLFLGRQCDGGRCYCTLWSRR